VRKVTDRIVVLDEGEVVEEGPSHILSVSPRSRAARQLVESSPALYVVDSEGPDEAPFVDVLSQ
jgi:peptide/nickel transport system ATP-binding protein